MTSRTGTPRHRRSLLRATAAAVMVVLLGTACSGSGGGGGAAPGSTAPGFPRTIDHAMGRTEVPRPPVKVAAMDSSFIDATLALETPVAAYTEYRSRGEGPPSYLTDADKRFLVGSQDVGTQAAPDVEKLYGVAPDLIVSAKVRHERIYDQFSRVAPTIFSQTTGPTWKENIRLLARALGKEQLAEQKIGAYERRARSVGDQIRAKLGRTPTVSLVRFTAGEPTVRLYSSASFGGIVMADAGMARPPGQPDEKQKIATNVSQEQISQLDADHLFISTFSDPNSQEGNARAAFEANPLWGTLKGQRSNVDDAAWFTSVSLQGADKMLDDLATAFGVSTGR